jgi:GGDEF domain-containing protein
MGVAVCQGNAIYWEDSVNVADARLYQAKHAHKRKKGCIVKEPPGVPGIRGRGEKFFPG